MNNSFTRAIIATLTLASIGCDSAEKRAKRQHEIHEAQIAQEVEALSQRRGAITDWQEPFAGKQYTIEVEPIFLRSDRRPILFYATLEDVRRLQGAVMLYMRTTPIKGEPTIDLVLDCSGCDLQKLKVPDNSLGDFAVVVDPSMITKTIGGTDDSPDFVLNGKFIEALFVDDFAFESARSHLK